ncbi:uncharacterized protein YehS (DUF1456 family) [Oceanisphaera litoralis]|uniref:DUF1456 family protein n=1 Tax=Oceanisphaera litoralis TaxID=225144 RepID=UPI00195ADCB1|nr:DUF1456 family protein [Oceanisphaera litoralis]MBM7456028.1 uncharacterized protein YehS (DUF1456 family) [Oceanisphaera litoralis]
MTNNDILRRVRYALDLPDQQAIALFSLGDVTIDEAQFLALLAKEEDANYHSCSNEQILGFLDGLILKNRGPRQGGPAPRAEQAEPINNQVFKKLRVALELKEEDILGLLSLAGFEVRKPELTSLFRKPGHKHYQACGDQFLRNFLQGLALQRRHGAE